MTEIRMRGLRAGNLRHLDLTLPHGAWTAVHGPSGAGKSALLFRTLEPVARQRFRVLEDPQALPGVTEAWLPHVADSIEGLQPVLAAAGEIPRHRRKVEIGTALDLWGGLVRVFAHVGQRLCPSCATAWTPLRAATLQAKAEACEEGDTVLLFVHCGQQSADALLGEGWTRVRLGDGGLARLEECSGTLPADAWLLLDRLKWRAEHADRFADAAAEAVRRRQAVLLEIAGREHAFAAPDHCPACATQVSELAAEDLLTDRACADWAYDGSSWADWCRRPLADWVRLPAELGARLHRRLSYLVRTRMGHLSADRTLGTLSLGEGRRLELVALLAQVRRGQLALFDEPGMGLHGSERRALASLLRELVDQGNTVLTADPAREFLEAADQWLLLGPGGGPEGGEVVGQGPRAELPPLADEELPPFRDAPAQARPSMVFRDLRTRHLAVEELEMPMGCLVALVGVSGSGKSTLFEAELVPRLREARDFEGELPLGGVRVLLERALGSSAFSTVATLAGAWSEIRSAFAEGEEGRMRGLQPGDLVARLGQGACERCRGHGVDPAGLPCESCEGLGLRDDLLELRLRHRSLREWLTTPLEKLEKRLPSDGRLRNLVRHLTAVGLGQRTFGERGRYLSLGERGRIALARALASTRRDRPQLFLLDEPCLGLPFREARKVVELLRELCAQGHSFWVAEHHEVLLRGADHVLELGPGAGPEGGQLLYAGAPAGLVEQTTPTGLWLNSRAGESLVTESKAAAPSLHSRVLAEDCSRVGRQFLEDALQRELATRSPLLADHVGGRLWGREESLDPEDDASLQDASSALAPVAWPVAVPPETRLDELLGLAASFARVVSEHGQARCPHCGGLGPWTGLEEALLHWQGAQSLGQAWVFTLEPQFPAGAAGMESAFLLAAGYRRVWRNGARQPLRRDQAWQAGDRLWLDQFDPSEELRSGRIQDLERQADQLAGGGLRVACGSETHDYRAGSCRDCGKATDGWGMQLAGWDLARLRTESLASALTHLQRELPDEALFQRAHEVLAGTPFLQLPSTTRVRQLDEEQARLARLLGWCIAPVEGVVLLHDQPLSGLPAKLAQRFAKLLQDGAHGWYWWTDPEAYHSAAPAPAIRAPRGISLRRFPLGFDLAAAATRLPVHTRLRDALGLTQALREHYLRLPEAKLRGWGPADLGRGPQGRRCADCHGEGGRAVHPELLLECATCRGSGFARETAVLEDRGLRWPDLGMATLRQLASHFASSPSLARPLEWAVKSGLEDVRLDERLLRLPRGWRSWAPVLAELAEERDSGLSAVWAAPTAGWNRLELERFLSTIEVFASSQHALDWRENHPGWQAPESP